MSGIGEDGLLEGGVMEGKESVPGEGSSLKTGPEKVLPATIEDQEEMKFLVGVFFSGKPGGMHDLGGLMASGEQKGSLRLAS